MKKHMKFLEQYNNSDSSFISNEKKKELVEKHLTQENIKHIPELYDILMDEYREKYIHKIAKIVQERMKEVESTGLDANSQQLKIAVLAAMNIADELLQSEDKKNRLITRIESKGNSFIEYIDERIKEIESTKEN